MNVRRNVRRMTHKNTEDDDLRFQKDMKSIEWVVPKKYQRDNIQNPHECSQDLTQSHWVGWTAGQGEGRVLQPAFVMNATNMKIGRDEKKIFDWDAIEFYQSKEGRNQAHLLDEATLNRIKESVTAIQNTVFISVRYSTKHRQWYGLTNRRDIYPLPDSFVNTTIKNVRAGDKWYAHNIAGPGFQPDRWIGLLKGKRGSDSKAKRPKGTGPKLRVSGKGKDDTCIIASLVNLLSALGDEKAVNVLNQYLNNDTWIKFCKGKDGYGKALTLIRSLGYQAKPVTIENVFEYSFVDMHLCSVTLNHCVGIWGDKIYDASHTHCISLNPTNIGWCCDNDFSHIDRAHKIVPPKSISKNLKKLV